MNRDPSPRNAREVAAADQAMAQTGQLVEELIVVANDAKAAGCSPLERFVAVGLRAADAACECPPEHQDGHTIGLLTTAVIAAADARRASPD